MLASTGTEQAEKCIERVNRFWPRETHWMCLAFEITFCVHPQVYFYGKKIIKKFLVMCFGVHYRTMNDKWNLNFRVQFSWQRLVETLNDFLMRKISVKMFWPNSFSSPFRFRIDNNDHVIDVNKGNLQFEYDQVHIICPYYEPGTNENETEKYIVYNVSKVEYETCRITNPNPRIITICDKPFNTTLVTISFRPFTPQPGGLEFKPGNDYYFICKLLKDMFWVLRYDL